MSGQANHNEIYIVVPVFNEHTIIKKVMGELTSLPYNLVIIDDGSGEDIVATLTTFPSIHYIRHKVNLGQGAALQTGIDYALQKGAQLIVTFDGDGQHSAADIAALLTPLQNDEVDITLASRFLNKGSHNAPLSKQWTLKAGRWINFLFSGLYLSDAHNGLRAMNRKTAGLIRFKENRMAHATEILFSIRHHKLRYKEIPAHVTYTAYSKSKGQSIFNSIRIFFDLVLHKLFE